jgi:hypothetical protein
MEALCPGMRIAPIPPSIAVDTCQLMHLTMQGELGR